MLLRAIPSEPELPFKFSSLNAMSFSGTRIWTVPTALDSFLLFFFFFPSPLLMLFPLPGMPFPSFLPADVLSVFQDPNQIACPPRNLLPDSQAK